MRSAIGILVIALILVGPLVFAARWHRRRSKRAARGKLGSMIASGGTVEVFVGGRKLREMRTLTVGKPAKHRAETVGPTSPLAVRLAHREIQARGGSIDITIPVAGDNGPWPCPDIRKNPFEVTEKLLAASPPIEWDREVKGEFRESAPGPFTDVDDTRPWTKPVEYPEAARPVRRLEDDEGDLGAEHAEHAERYRGKR